MIIARKSVSVDSRALPWAASRSIPWVDLTVEAVKGSNLALVRLASRIVSTAAATRTRLAFPWASGSSRVTTKGEEYATSCTLAPAAPLCRPLPLHFPSCFLPRRIDGTTH